MTPKKGGDMPHTNGLPTTKEIREMSENQIIERVEERMDQIVLVQGQDSRTMNLFYLLSHYKMSL